MKRKMLAPALAAAAACLLLAGCKKKEEEPQGPVDEVLSAVTLGSLAPGHFYVKNGEEYYLLPFENANFDTTKLPDGRNGMTDQSENRLASFVYKDMAIPTMYKNDQLVYVSDGSMNIFNWERFTEECYSIGLSGLTLSGSGRINSSGSTDVSAGSSIASAIAQLPVTEDSVITVDKINGASLSGAYLNDSGIITGMQKDGAANVDIYLGTTPYTVSVSADTRYFKSFEAYQTEKYSLSTNGYAIVEVPSYFKSGYYSINNTGFMKFINADRGSDESSITLDIPYYYTSSKTGNTITYYEWQEENGIVNENTASTETTGTREPADYDEYDLITVDASQNMLDITIGYKYVDEDAEMEANNSGSFPKAYLIDPFGNLTKIEENASLTGSQANTDGRTYLATSMSGPVAGDWYIVYENFDGIRKNMEVSITSDNATSYMHNGNSTGKINIYYDASEGEHEFEFTWEDTAKAVTSVKITAPDKTVYSTGDTPENVVANEFGRYVIRVPYIMQGTYKFEITGNTLGRVWVDCTAAEITAPDAENAGEGGDDLQETAAGDEGTEGVPETIPETAAAAEGETAAG